ncbi:MAG TPA: hypothetical protein VGM02_04870 [Acidobacteriaceae bacterium]
MIGIGLNFTGEWLSQRTGISWFKDVVSIEVFLFVWAVVQASFVQRLTSSSTISITTGVASVFVTTAALLDKIGRLDTDSWAAILGLIGGLVLWIDLYRMRSVLEDHYNSVEPYGLSVSLFWLLLLGPFYLQYHLRRIALWKDQQSNSLKR